MVIHGSKRLVLFHSHWVEIARNGFTPVEFALAVCLVDGADAHAARQIGGKHAILAVNNLGNDFAFGVEIAHPMLLNLLLRAWKQVVPNHGEHFFQFFKLFFGDWSPCVALNAACAQAGINIAAEKAFGKVKTHQCISNFKCTPYIVIHFFDYSLSNSETLWSSSVLDNLRNISPL